MICPHCGKPTDEKPPADPRHKPLTDGLVETWSEAFPWLTYKNAFLFPRDSKRIKAFLRDNPDLSVEAILDVFKTCCLAARDGRGREKSFHHQRMRSHPVQHLLDGWNGWLRGPVDYGPGENPDSDPIESDDAVIDDLLGSIAQAPESERADLEKRLNRFLWR